MTDTRPAATASRPSSGSKTRRKDPAAIGLSFIRQIAGSPLLDRYGLRSQVEKAAFVLTRNGLKAGASIGKAAAASRQFVPVKGAGSGTRQARPAGGDLFDVTPTEDQQMILDVVKDFAATQVRDAADAADRTSTLPDELVSTATELGVWQLSVPEKLGGFNAEAATTTNVLVAEALAQGDLGIAVGILSPAAVATAISLWGTGDQQGTYLPAFVGDKAPHAALAVMEPTAVFNPFALTTTATKVPGGYVLDGVKSLVVTAARDELFVIAAQVQPEGKPALFIVESGAAGLSVTAEPGMGLRAAETGTLTLKNVTVPDGARLGTATDNPYTDAVRLSRIGWAALAVGTGQAVLDYVIPYVNTREAFGEPVSYRQGVAFTVADMATELAGMRLATYRAASRAEQGLDYARETALARRLSADFGMQIGSDGVQMLGGHGFVREHPVERWYRDLRAVGVMEGVVLV